jgi:hypothetical protein
MKFVSRSIPNAAWRQLRRLSYTAITTSVIILTPALAADAGEWQFQKEPDASACSLTYLDSNVRLLFIRKRGGDEAQVIFANADLPEEFAFYWQTNSGPRHRLTAYEASERGNYLIAGGTTAVAPYDLLLELEPVEYLSLAVTPKTIFTMNMGGFASAFAEFRGCSIPPLEADAKTLTTPTAESETEDEEDQDFAETLTEQPSGVIGEFLCEVSGSDLLGVPDINGNDRSTPVTLTIFSDGRATYNGSPLRPQVNRKTADGTTDFVTYDVRDIMRATGPDPNAPPVAGLNEEQMQAYGAFLGAGSAMMQMALGDRSRSLFVSLRDGTVAFFDYTNERQITNQRAPQCVRTQ